MIGPEETYTIEPNTADTMMRDWYVVRVNGVAKFVMPKDRAERFASDPSYRAEVWAKWPERLPN